MGFPFEYKIVSALQNVTHMKVTKENSEEYSWGTNCFGWHLVNDRELSIIQELMPPNTAEVQHKHLKSQQFFYILKGEATFTIEGKTTIIKEHQGVHIPKKHIHQIKNNGNIDLEFLVISQPHSHKDRIIE